MSKKAPLKWLGSLAVKAIDEMGDIFYDTDLFDGRQGETGCKACVDLGEDFEIKVLDSESAEDDRPIHACVLCGARYTPDEIDIYEGEGKLSGRRPLRSELQANAVETAIVNAIAEALRGVGIEVES